MDGEGVEIRLMYESQTDIRKWYGSGTTSGKPTVNATADGQQT